MTDESIESVAELFLNRDYVLKKFKIGKNEEEIYTSEAATTDFDLTGQVVWPAAEVISWSIYQTNTDEIKDTIPDFDKNQINIKGKNVLELGAGCGMVGITAARLGAKQVMLTDGNTEILKILNKNVQLFKLKNVENVKISVNKLEWGNLKAIDYILDNDWVPDVILAADVFQSSFGSPMHLFETVKYIFEKSNNKDFLFYACFALRKTTNEDLVKKCAFDAGFEIESLCIKKILPSDKHPDSFTKEKLRLFRFKPIL